MKKIVLISCTSRKRLTKTKARHLYDKSPLFRKCFEYAELLRPDGIFILSAKYGLLDLDKVIKPYNMTLNYLSPKHRLKKPEVKCLSNEERKIWAKKVINQLSEIADLKNDKFILLAPYNYREFLIPHLSYYEAPMENINMYHQQSWLDRQISKLRKGK